MGVYFKLEENTGIIEFDLPDSKVNLLTGDVIQRLDKILDEIQSNSKIKGVLVFSRKKDVFIAGADIREIEGITEPADGEAKSRAGQDILNKLEDLKVPTVAVIDGVTLGGGCEFILACRYRIATFNEKVKIGLPEVNLGIVPGFGGTYRLPRLVGLVEAVRMITSGRAIDGNKALKIGLVDRLYPQKGLEFQARVFLKEIENKKLENVRRKKAKGLTAFLENSPLGQNILFSQTRKTILKATKGFYPAPLKAAEVVQKTIRMNRAHSLVLEAKTFSQLAVTEVSKNLVKIFYLSEKYKKLMPSGTENARALPVHKCAVVGAGIMGGGIAQILAYNNMAVRLKDINYNAVAQGFQAASKVFRQAVKRRKLSAAQANVKMSQISGTIDYSGFKSADLVIEAVVENMDIKRKVFKEISAAVSPKTVICTNTSALSVTEMAQQASDPSKVIGLHFFNPVHRMPLIEIITTRFTSPETVLTALGLTKRLGKTPVLVKDSTGFLVNRILLAYLNEAGRILEEGKKVEEIDAVMTRFGMPMGPFTLSDEVGSDVGIKVLHILESSFGERFKPVDIFEKVFEKGWLGKKSGKGFYIHGKKRVPNSGIHALLKNVSTRRTDNGECLKRMVYIMVNEAARCLEEGIIDGADTVDIGMVMGTGFPPFRGGLLRYADSVGLKDVVRSLEDFNQKFKTERFTPSSFLVKLSKEGKGFYHG